MHELSITENILSIAIKHAGSVNALQVTDIYLKIGSLSSYVDDSIQFYWDLISKDSICSGAQVFIERLPAQLKCLACDNSYVLDGELLPCPACGSNRIHILSGNEFYVESIAVIT